ncbi:MAG: sugar ABC transporter permease [Chloroflexi bacterium HGW-Chloroflexi-2]|jgi:multiple sugar transport system permease protein|nr:MAG: sugar ABC transporter permease [Chloroflexi bacterium HGW-Chloroflexi-2]
MQSSLDSFLPPKPPSLVARFGNFVDRTFQYWTIAPLVIVLLLLVAYPTFQLLRMSVSEVDIVKGQAVWEFVGLKHLETALQDPVVPTALKNTLVFVIAVVIIETFLALVISILVSRSKHLVGLYRTVLLIPLLVPPIAIGTMWRLMYDYNYGFINQALKLIGIVAVPTWTADPQLAMPSVVLVDLWHWTSFMFLIILAGLESMPQEVNEAARVDGASEFQVLRFITLPLLRPTLITAIMLRTIFAFKVFDEIFLLTSGGPGTATEVISLYIYKVFSGQFRLGYASFLALGLSVIISIFVIFYRRIGRRAA